MQPSKQLMQRESFIKVMDFHFYMNNRIDVFEHFNVESFLRNYGICVSLKYRGKGVSESLIRCGINYMQRLGLTVMEGLFTSKRYSRLARKMGFQVLYSKPYSSWLLDRKTIFPTLAEGGGSVFIMAVNIQA
uniref:N-acetyltransferase domain-containing protein n=1 Tax=Timema tahoe TaxID=61484 RepID=A0A7R9ICA3_9NEOP|nr:unnamed protein product [Timema tahoe]